MNQERKDITSRSRGAEGNLVSNCRNITKYNKLDISKSTEMWKFYTLFKALSKKYFYGCCTTLLCVINTEES